MTITGLVLSDLHAHTAWPLSKPQDGLSDRFFDLVSVLDQAGDMIETYGVRELYLLGDLLHRRHFISFRLYNSLMASLSSLMDQVEHTYILVGNHDYEDDAGEHALYPYAHMRQVTVVDEPQRVQALDGALTLLPYLHDPARMDAAVATAMVGVPVMAHYAATGVQLESGYWLDSPIERARFLAFPWTIFGHVHKPSTDVSASIEYVGAPLHFDFGDSGERHALLVTQAGVVQRLPFTFPVFTTAKFPRVPSAPSQSGYLRVVGVPRAEAEDVHRQARGLGWRDVLVQEDMLTRTVQTAIASATFALDEATLTDYIDRTYADLAPDERRAVVQEGLRYMEEARG